MASSEDLSSWLSDGATACANCINYSWPRTQERLVLRCSRCKIPRYCSKECQVEHWVKVHKPQCKYLAGEKVLPKAVHDPASCPGCVKQQGFGLEGMANENNPWLGCSISLDPHFVANVHIPNFIEPGVISAPLPFTLGEMSGKFLTKAEQTISLMMHVLHKMKLVNHPAWTLLPKATEDLYIHTGGMRNFIWCDYLYINPGYKLEHTISKTIMKLFDIMHEVTIEIDNKLVADNLTDQGVYRYWDTYRLLFKLLFLFESDIMRRETESVEIPVMPDEDERLKVTSGQFLDKWGKVLDSMPGKLIPYEDVLKIFCGELDQECVNCFKKITVGDIQVNGNNPDSDLRQGPIYFTNYISASVCGNSQNSQCMRKVGFQDIGVMQYYAVSKLKSDGMECDNCGLPGVKMHRCTGCLTKLYCGVQCRDEDWEKVHMQVCRKGETRKVKSGKKDRKMEGTLRVDNFVRQMNNSSRGRGT